MSSLSPQEDRIQALANLLSLVAIIGGLDKTAVQRVLITLGSNLIRTPEAEPIPPDLVTRLLGQIAREEGRDAALRVANGLGFVAEAWKPVLDAYPTSDPHRVMPYAEIIYTLANRSGFALHDYGAFERFGGTDLVLPLPQLTAALKTYAAPRTSLVWEMVGFEDPPDQALVASDADAMFLFKAAATNLNLRFSEFERSGDQGARQEHDVPVDAPLFAAFVAGLLGDLLYWSTRLRADALTSQHLWRRIQAVLASSPQTGPAAGQPAPPQDTA